MPTTILLDVDGTLVDSNDAHALSWVEALAELGHEVPYARVRELIGKGGDKLLPETIRVEKDSPEGKEITKRRDALFAKTYLPKLLPCRGARELLLALKREGLQLVVATSASEAQLQGLLKVAGLDDLIEQSATSSDAKSSKPDPDIIVAALHRAKCAPHDAIMLGDTPYDVQASKKAGVRSIALRSGGWDTEDLSGAAAVYDDAQDLLNHLDASPIRSNR